MSAATETAKKDIAERLKDAERELVEAERFRGAAVLDGGDPADAADRVTQARAAVDGLRAAREEWTAREHQREAVRLERENVVARWRVLAWCQDYVERLIPVLRLREELPAAEARVMELGELKGRSGKTVGWDPWMNKELRERRLPRLIGEIPDRAAEGGMLHGREEGAKASAGRLTVADCERLAGQLAPLVEEAAAALQEEGVAPDRPWGMDEEAGR